MRISDWSSDVCSSDLSVCSAEEAPGGGGEGRGAKALRCLVSEDRCGCPRRRSLHRRWPASRRCLHAPSSCGTSLASLGHCMSMISSCRKTTIAKTLITFHRSEEHTSELQSLMRISYAVFCLK